MGYQVAELSNVSQPKPHNGSVHSIIALREPYEYLGIIVWGFIHVSHGRF